MCYSFDFLPPTSLYFTSWSSLSTQLTRSVRVSVSMWERIYICLYVQPCIHKHMQNTHTYMCFCLNCPLWFSHGYLLVISQQTVKAPTTPTSLSTVAYISFPCLHIVLNCPQMSCWSGGASGPVASSVNLSSLFSWDWRILSAFYDE